MRRSQAILINLSGRGDKDIRIVAERMGEQRVAH
jgi:tryptophan synthase beta subunit